VIEALQAAAGERSVAVHGYAPFAGLPALRSAVEAFIAVGVSKFVLVPVVEPEDWAGHLGDVAAATLDLVS
jgi:hypothetical protein